MKKMLLFIIVCGLGLCLPGCTVRKATTIQKLNVAEPVRALPLTADLSISEQKVRGEAHTKLSGKFGDEDLKNLISVATARALGQDPPKPEAADVLVALNVNVERNGSDLKVIVTGYPAWYRNFRTVEEVGDSAWLILTHTGAEAKGVYEGGRRGLSFAAPGVEVNADETYSGNDMKKGVGTQYGIRAEPRFNFLSFEDDGKTSPGFGWALGLALKFPISDAVSVNSGTVFRFGGLGSHEWVSYDYEYSYGEYRRVRRTETEVYKEFGLSIPAFVQYTLPVGYPVYAEAGIQLGLNFKGRRDGFDFGWGFGAGYHLLPGLDLGLRWVNNIELSTLGIGATYTF